MTGLVSHGVGTANDFRFSATSLKTRRISGGGLEVIAVEAGFLMIDPLHAGFGSVIGINLASFQRLQGGCEMEFIPCAVRSFLAAGDPA